MSDIEKSDYWDRYDPNWESKWQFHHDEFEKYSNMDVLSLTEENYRHQKQMVDFHLQSAQSAWVDHFKNAEEYGRYIIGSLPLEEDGQKFVKLEQDFSKLKTVDDANLAYDQASDFLQKQRNFRHNASPADDQHALFQSHATRHWQTHVNYMELTAANVYIHTDLIASVEKHKETTRVCLNDIYQNKGRSAMNGYETIATLLYDQALQKDGIDPHKIEWFSRVDPLTGLPEQLQTVDMNFQDGQYRQARFGRIVHDTVPMTLRNCAFNCEDEELSLSPENIVQDRNSNPIAKAFKSFQEAASGFFGFGDTKSDHKPTGPCNSL